jgi:hypothetical protein
MVCHRVIQTVHCSVLLCDSQCVGMCSVAHKNMCEKFLHLLIQTNLHYLLSTYFISQHLHVSGLLLPIIKRYHYIYNSWYMLYILVDWLLAGPHDDGQ